MKAVRRHVQVRNILQVPIDSVQNRRLRCCLHANVSTRTRDAEVILMIGSGEKSQLKLRREVRHEALEDSLGRCRR